MRLAARLTDSVTALVWMVSVTCKFALAQSFPSSTPTPPLITQPQPPCQFNPQSSPEMVLIPGGHFQMGSADNDTLAESDEKPQHWVAVQPFAISRCEITVAQFRQFVDETGYVTRAETPDATQQNTPKGCFRWTKSKFDRDKSLNWRNTGFEQSAQHPVTCITWDDSQAYIQWLTARTGVAYRLPTEAEWEYAARVNYTGLFGFIDDAESTLICDFANVRAPQCDDGFEFTAPVGQLTPNGFGLYDMHGNVWEWTEDCWHGDYNGAPIDGAAWAASHEGDCSGRMIRGGSWLYVPRLARSADRNRINLYETYNNVGFRLARTL